MAKSIPIIFKVRDEKEGSASHIASGVQNYYIAGAGMAICELRDCFVVASAVTPHQTGRVRKLARSICVYTLPLLYVDYNCQTVTHWLQSSSQVNTPRL